MRVADDTFESYSECEWVNSVMPKALDWPNINSFHLNAEVIENLFFVDLRIV